MNEPFATVEDLIALYRPLTTEERERAENLLPLLSNQLRTIAKRYGRDIDSGVADDDAYADAVKLVVISACTRIFGQSTDGAAVSQETQSALGYSLSLTYATPTSGYANAFLRSDLKSIGIGIQRIGAREIYETDPWNHNNAVQQNTNG